jgi:hypothetical protein
VVYFDETGRKGSLSQAFNFAVCQKALGGVACVSPETHVNLSLSSLSSPGGQSHCGECAAPLSVNFDDSGATFAFFAQQVAFTRGHKHGDWVVDDVQQVVHTVCCLSDRAVAACIPVDCR